MMGEGRGPISKMFQHVLFFFTYIQILRTRVYRLQMTGVMPRSVVNFWDDKITFLSLLLSVPQTRV